MKKVKVVFYPNKRKTNAKTKVTPIYMRIAKADLGKVETKLEVYVDEVELKYWNDITQRSEFPGTKVNRVLEDLMYEFESLPYRFKEEYPEFSPQQIKDKVLKTENFNTDRFCKVLDYVDNYYHTVVIPNQHIVLGTKNNYKKSIRHFRNYMNYSKNNKCLMNGLNTVIALGFYDYLCQEIPTIGKRSIQKVSAASVIEKIKHIFERAVDTELIRNNPFKKIKLDKRSPKRDELNLSEIKLLETLPLKNRMLEVYRDIFLFLIYTGLPYGDFYNLTKNDITEENGEVILTIKRSKTGIELKQALIAPAVQLIKKYEQSYETIIYNRLFPKRHLNSVNEHLKFIQEKAGINKKLSTHIGRHTCSQMLRETGTINLDVINSMLGWSNGRLGASMNYRRTSINMLKDAKTKYETFLNQ
jgi:integrase